MGNGLAIANGKTATSVGVWCMNVNFGGKNLFNFNLYNRFGVDLYDTAPKCALPSCKFFCGNGACDIAQGETASNCPIDCNVIFCPLKRRRLWGRN